MGVSTLFLLHHGATQPHENIVSENVTKYAEISTTSSAQFFSSASSSPAIRLPILVYHIVRPSYASDNAAVRALAVTPENFDAQMQYLKDAGYHVVRFGDLESYFASSTPLPSKSVILSFDDGWGDQYTYAFPILEKYHYPATFFVFTNAIDHKGFLTWDDLKQIVAAGMTIGDHSRSHPYLTQITSTSTLVDEIAGSKQILESKLGISVDEFAYPFGQYNSDIVALVQQAGYKSARGDFYSGDQSAAHLFELSAMNAPTTTVRFEQLLPAQ
jgi:peptidoglycan/xylan/chitin deacetylase (PgdA/CDA1 family)